MDSTAISLCMDNDLPIIVFNLLQPGNIMRAVTGVRIGTLVHGGRVMTDEVLGDVPSRRWRRPSAAFKQELSHVRTGRATTALLDGITVEYYGAQDAAEPGRHALRARAALLVIQPYDKSVVAAIEKAIQAVRSRTQPAERRQAHPRARFPSSPRSAAATW